MSLRLGAVLAVNLEHLLHDLANRRERVESARLDLVEQAPELGVVLDLALEMRLRPAGGDREHLPGQVLPPPLLEQPLPFEVGAMLLDLLPQLGNVLTARGLGEDDRRAPRALLV